MITKHRMENKHSPPSELVHSICTIYSAHYALKTTGWRTIVINSYCFSNHLWNNTFLCRIQLNFGWKSTTYIALFPILTIKRKIHVLCSSVIDLTWAWQAPKSTKNKLWSEPIQKCLTDITLFGSHGKSVTREQTLQDGCQSVCWLKIFSQRPRYVKTPM